MKLTTSTLAHLFTAALLFSLPTSANPSLATWVSPTSGGVIVPSSGLNADRGTMIGAVLILRDTVTNAQTVLTFGAAELRSSGHLSVADGAYGANQVVESVAYTMLYPGGLLKQVVEPRLALPASKRALSYVFDLNQLTLAQRAELLPTPNWTSNNSLMAILTGSIPGAVLQSTKCNYFLHSLADGTL